MKKAFWIMVCVILAMAILFVGMLFVEGSQEEFPTPEQIEKARIAYGLLLVPLMGAEAFSLSRVFKKK